MKLGAAAVGGIVVVMVRHAGERGFDRGEGLQVRKMGGVACIGWSEGAIEGACLERLELRAEGEGWKRGSGWHLARRIVASAGTG